MNALCKSFLFGVEIAVVVRNSFAALKYLIAVLTFVAVTLKYKTELHYYIDIILRKVGDR